MFIAAILAVFLAVNVIFTVCHVALTRSSQSMLSPISLIFSGAVTFLLTYYNFI